MNNLRKYDKGTAVYEFYREMHQNQTYEYVTNKTNNSKMTYNQCLTVEQVLSMMDSFIDPSDPDTDEMNSVHAYQTAESIRLKYPKDICLQVCGLIHDLGKILFSFGEPTWAVVGDTYAVGCKFPKSIVCYETMKENPDYYNPKYNLKHGVYTPKCGLSNLNITIGHDEYLYSVLQNNHNHIFTQRYQDIIRFHSLYPWHTGGAYTQFMTEHDYDTLKDVRKFNECDLYSKEDKNFEVTDDIKQYYKNLLKIYFPSALHW
jgi:inositol oxygenase